MASYIDIRITGFPRRGKSNSKLLRTGPGTQQAFLNMYLMKRKKIDWANEDEFQEVIWVGKLFFFLVAMEALNKGQKNRCFCHGSYVAPGTTSVT